ncbi:DUF6279 family lipoprotein [Bdellovibrio reynosensis]|uniref:DUF6279 family lipoprotein n=1 Tax=Bdellovibrio reynosensis TaxID=2835041 RepID=A0ABY4C9R6_9BACT|nr:DUF6279 family lipoprotein [Bdellovibrio reynosensis]UOF01479.1 DUF6279 family lipoprotein [Bdellovibrio reynosensis]
MKILVLSFLLLATTACSRSSVMMSFADTLAVSKTDEYFDLTSQQKEDLKKDLRQDIDALKKEFLPEVAKTLRRIESEVSKGKIESELIATHFTEFHVHFKKLTSYFANTAVKTVATFKPEQFDYFEKTMKEEIKDRSDVEEQNEKAFKRYRRSLEFWIGGLSQDQKDRIQAFLKQNPYPVKLETENKEHIVKQFLEVKTDKEKLKVYVRTLYLDYEAPRLPSFTESLQLHKKAFQNFLSESLWPTISKNQLENLKANLISRAEELEKLAQR